MPCRNITSLVDKVKAERLKREFNSFKAFMKQLDEKAPPGEPSTRASYKTSQLIYSGAQRDTIYMQRHIPQAGLGHQHVWIQHVSKLPNVCPFGCPGTWSHSY